MIIPNRKIKWQDQIIANQSRELTIIVLFITLFTWIVWQISRVYIIINSHVFNSAALHFGEITSLGQVSSGFRALQSWYQSVKFFISQRVLTSVFRGTWGFDNLARSLSEAAWKRCLPFNDSDSLRFFYCMTVFRWWNILLFHIFTGACYDCARVSICNF